MSSLPLLPDDDGPREIPIDDGDSGWQRDKSGKEYVKAVGRRGIVYRQGQETVADAHERDAQPRPQGRPQRKTKPKMPPPPPPKADLRLLEQQLAEALKAPAMPAAMFGDEWAANHFVTNAPLLARNLVLASETNPWLRRKLENAATGGDMMMQIVSLVGLGGAFVMYLAPPIVWWLNVPLPDKGRELLGIPERPSDDGPNLAAVA